MSRLAFAVSLAWGVLLALTLLGAVLTRSVGLSVYVGCALVVWGHGLLAVRGRAGAGPRPALMVIPVSLLGPLALLTALIRRSRRGRSSRLDQPKLATAAHVTPAQPPTLEQPWGARAAPVKPVQPAEPSIWPPTPVPPPGARRQPPRHPIRVLAPMLVAPALAFPVAALGFLTLIALGGQGPLTIHDARGAVTVGAVVAGFVLIVTVRVWFEQSRASSKRVRALGFLLIGVAATPVIAGTIFFEHPHSSKNLAKPSISGCTHPHCLVMAQHGRWTSLGGRVLYDYQWQDCAQTCTDIWRATHRTYLLTDHDLGRRIRLGVSASSGAGIRDFSSNWTYSTETAVVAH